MNFHFNSTFFVSIESYIEKIKIFILNKININDYIERHILSSDTTVGTKFIIVIFKIN